MRELDLAKKAAILAGNSVSRIAADSPAAAKEGRGNFVTSADYASEEIIIQLIKEHFPSDAILSEESFTQLDNPDAFERLWVLDPLDGTNNYRFGRRYSCVSVGFASCGKLIAGAVYDPFHNELFSAVSGGGAWCNERRLLLGSGPEFAQCSLATDNSYDVEETKDNFRILLGLEHLPWVLMRGSAVLSMCEVAAGRLDLYFHTRLKPWDNAAAFLIAAEAGAAVADFSGDPVSFLAAQAVVGSPALVAAFLAELRCGG
ncbi:MAG TPA: inositol monophosphatase family protein [Oligoflexia bacterium]|nr:inositol monophosphatase family protein [Oligoflexia bacterium]